MLLGMLGPSWTRKWRTSQKVEPAEVEAKIRPGEATVMTEAAEVEFEKAFPVTSEDIGDLMLVSGSVVGRPGSAEFFVRTEGNRVAFIQSNQAVSLGQRVEVVGSAQAADVAVFEGWEHEFLGDLEPGWNVLRIYYVRANAVAALL